MDEKQASNLLVVPLPTGAFIARHHAGVRRQSNKAWFFVARPQVDGVQTALAFQSCIARGRKPLTSKPGPVTKGARSAWGAPLAVQKNRFASLVPVVPDHSAQDSDSGHPAAPKFLPPPSTEESAAEPPSGDAAASPSMEVDGSTTTEVPSEAGPAKHAREKASPEKTGKRVSAHPRGFSDSTLHDNDCKRRLLAWPSLMPSRNSSHCYEFLEFRAISRNF